jgi:1-acyl-sn-glycerol-3-phosphate acyltransferase
MREAENRLNFTDATKMDSPNEGKLLGWLFTPLHLLTFLAILLIFHPLQVLARTISYSAHKYVVDLLSGAILLSLKLVGAKVKISYDLPLPTDRPLIIVSNHQSHYDIPLLGWVFRKNHPKYVSKIELAKWIPSVSYNLRHGGSIAIDRKDARQALPLIGKLGNFVEENNYSVCIFPEGTRARDGQIKTFKPGGLVKLIRSTPSALIVPVAISNSWKLMRHMFRPIPFGVNLSCAVLEPIEPGETPVQEIILEAERRIRESIAEPLTEEV